MGIAGSRNVRRSTSFWKLETALCRSFGYRPKKVGRRTEGGSRSTSMSTIASRNMSAPFVSDRTASAGCGGTFSMRSGDASTIQMLETPLKSATFRHASRRAAAVPGREGISSCQSSTRGSEFSAGLSGPSFVPWQWMYPSATVGPGSCSLCLVGVASTGFPCRFWQRGVRAGRRAQVKARIQ